MLHLLGSFIPFDLLKLFPTKVISISTFFLHVVPYSRSKVSTQAGPSDSHFDRSHSDSHYKLSCWDLILSLLTQGYCWKCCLESALYTYCESYDYTLNVQELTQKKFQVQGGSWNESTYWKNGFNSCYESLLWNRWIGYRGLFWFTSTMRKLYLRKTERTCSLTYWKKLSISGILSN